MNRIDRLSAILIHLQSKKTVTAKELAVRFSISIRTVYRDIRSLEAAGIPIGSDTGLGYYLVEGYHLPPVMFTSEESGALLLAGKLVGVFTDTQIKKNFDSALYKIRSVLENEDKNFLSEIEKKIKVVDAARINTSIEAYFIKDIQAALYKKNVIEIQYRSQNREQPTLRNIEPISLGFYEYHWHLIAYCYLRNAYRDFRVDRIENLSITNIIFDEEKHPPVELIIKEMFESKDLCNVTVRLKKDNSYEIIKSKCILGFLVEKDLGDRMELMLLTDSLPILGKWLLNYGQSVEIIDPVELKNLMRQYATEIADQYL